MGQLCKESECINGSADAAIPFGLKSEELKKALEPLKSKKVLHFSTMAGAFGGFTAAADQEKFEGRIKQLASIWCCIHPPPKSSRAHLVRPSLGSARRAHGQAQSPLQCHLGAHLGPVTPFHNPRPGFFTFRNTHTIILCNFLCMVARAK